MLRQEGLVRRHDILTGHQCCRHITEGRIRTAHGLDDHIHLGIFQDAIHFGRHADAVEPDTARLVQVADGGPFPPDGTAAAPRQSIGMLGQ